MITSIRLQDFKGHRDTTVPLGRFTALVGPNGSGKTSVLEALWLLGQLARTAPDDVLRGNWALHDLLRRGAQQSCALGVKGMNGSAWSALLSFDIKEGYALGLDGNAPGATTAFRVLGSFIGPATLYKLSADRIAAAAYANQAAAEVGRDGTATSEALTSLKLGYDEIFERVEKDLRLIVPSVERVRVRQELLPSTIGVQPTLVKGSKIYFDFRGAPGVPAHLASEGTLITLAILTILHSPERPGILLLDDFDQSLHPRAQMELVRLIKRLLDEIPDLQIVATTHSPYVLDELDPSQIHAFALREDGTVASKRLSDHPEAERMKGSLTSGQLWTLDEERDWVLAEPAS